MDRTELDAFLRKHTEKERMALEGKYNDEDVVYKKYEEYAEGEGTFLKAYLFEDKYFLSSYENIGTNKQDRFMEVYPHKHNYIELNYVWSGKCTQIINGKNIVCQQGDICILDTKTIHSVEKAEENDIIVNILMRKEFFASTFFNRMTKQGLLAEFLMDAVMKVHDVKQYLLFKTHGNLKIHRLMEDLLCEYYSDALGKREVMESYMIILFTELLRTYRGNASKHTKHNEATIKIFDILEYIEKNYEYCPLHSVAQHFSLNEKYLTMLLKKRTGKSFIAHLQEQKLNKAKMLLINTELSITEIITLCGYSNTHFFYKKFYESEERTPAEYRTDIKKFKSLR
ncbi:AraC family transcriptional regulator [Cellulosilyticum sp. I15G10I2]|uniref:AraC family transcriptional regulator n=1 Tax=Cellulosilyticum sp. I15G10I2 TaxID=1892843 RepID=UPI00085C27F4|nr:AraC family transcriptional regulator [Cellulosilyticum sp. I15G10I2]